MAFITAWLKKYSLLLVLLLAFPAQANANFIIQKASPDFRDGKLYVNADMDLTLSNKVEEALSKGIPINILIELRLKRPRKILWDETIGEWSITRKLSYHALSSQYLVSTVGDPQVESFTSLSQALRSTGSLVDQEFQMNHFPGKNEKYLLEMRVSLSIESLPAPLRPVAYTSLAWRLNSGWTQWYAKH
ncbi:MAG: DUF4390 domain-containing protein [Acidiferrobacterales bacterium]|jgi:hypothetical protein|nr:DUF4390 domain-containing protein [Acidiferrobacterales bacterium]